MIKHRLAALPPVVYGCMAVFSSAAMIGLALYMGTTGLRIPFYLNHAIFLLVIIAVEVRNYRTTRNQYLLDKRMEEQDNERRVFELADSALYQAKHSGRARAVIFGDTPGQR